MQNHISYGISLLEINGVHLLMACILRILGAVLDADALASSADFEIYSVYRRGEPRNRVSRVLNSASGIKAKISDTDFYEFDQQLADALAFLETHADNLRLMSAFPGVDEAFLDFGTGWIGEAAQFWRFPPQLIEKLAEAGLALELSHYPVHE